MALLLGRRVSDFGNVADSPVTPEGQAIHEAGHVVFGVLYGKRLRGVKIRQGEVQADGITEWENDIPHEGALKLERIKPTCLVLFAGHEAQLLFQPDSITYYASHYNDRGQASKLFGRVSQLAEAEHLETWIAEVRDTLRLENVRRAILAVAQALLENSSLTGEQASEIARQNLTTSSSESASE